jgi:hypothetical protein
MLSLFVVAQLAAPLQVTTARIVGFAGEISRGQVFELREQSKRIKNKNKISLFLLKTEN